MSGALVGGCTRLRAEGLQTALDIKQLTPRRARQLMGGVRGSQLQLELSGIACFPLRPRASAPKLSATAVCLAMTQQTR